MTQNVTDQINAELDALSPDRLKQMLIEHLQKQSKRQASYNTPEAKARRKSYYEAKKDTPEWKAARKVQAEARKAKETALINLAKSKFTAQELAELGIR
jgi:L-lactate utilization protein LutC